jgi:hypothetical protein
MADTLSVRYAMADREWNKLIKTRLYWISNG